MTFQEIIIKLNEYWIDKGCIYIQPYDMQMGAGTFHSATFLKSLGPEPWNAAYVQPSRRPTDGRYGENPNRLQRYYQYQVVMKPSPSNFQELYIDSLNYIGINLLDNDIRFVEDNWESPTLGASGLGWEVWLNGMEVTQFTYFQQVAGIECRIVMGELTYGLERLAMYLQNVDTVYDLVWADTPAGTITYGDVYKQNEYEQSYYNFEYADTEDLISQFNTAQKQCFKLNELSLPLPAYEQAIQASHIFNLLDARHAISATERQAYILRIRRLTQSCANSYLKKREEIGFPLIKNFKDSHVSTKSK